MPRSDQRFTATRRTRRFAAGVAGLVALHVVAPGRPGNAAVDTLLWGLLPWDLAFPLAWMAAAWIAIIVLVRRVWTADPGQGRP